MIGEMCSWYLHAASGRVHVHIWCIFAQEGEWCKFVAKWRVMLDYRGVRCLDMLEMLERHIIGICQYRYQCELCYDWENARKGKRKKGDDKILAKIAM